MSERNLADRSDRISEDGVLVVDSSSTLGSPSTRRSFLRMLGLGGSIVLMPSVFVACDDDDNPTNPGPTPNPNPNPNPGPEAVTIDLSMDTGVLNFAYALEQLEAAFYAQVVSNFYLGVTSDEINVLRDLRAHEVAHREFLETALGDAAIPNLTVDFSDVDFTSRASVLSTARTFEDLGVGAYNGAGAALSDPDLLTIAGKIVSVEARHASVVRTLLGENFAPDAFDDATNPADVASAASGFIENEITLQNA